MENEKKRVREVPPMRGVDRGPAESARSGRVDRTGLQKAQCEARCTVRSGDVQGHAGRRGQALPRRIQDLIAPSKKRLISAEWARGRTPEPGVVRTRLDVAIASATVS